MKTHKLRLALLSAFSLFTFAVCFTVSADHSLKNCISDETERTQASLVSVAAADAECIENVFQRLIGEARSSAAQIALVGAESEQLYRCFDLNSKYGSADTALLFDENGVLKYGSLEYGGIFVSCAVKALVSGEPVISASAPCGDGVQRFAIAFPFRDAHDAYCAVALLYPASTLDELISASLLSGECSAYLLDESGSSVIRDDGSNPWQLSELSSLSGGFSACTNAAGADSLVYIQSAEINDWYIACGVPMSYIYERAQLTFRSNTAFVLITFLSMAALIIGSILFLASRQRKLLLERKRFNIAVSQSARAVFEYRRDKDKLSFISDCEHISLPGREKSISLSQFIDCLEQDDREELTKAIFDFESDGSLEITVRLSGLRNSNEFHWYHITARELAGSGGAASIVIGSIEDIDEREKERIDLLRKAVSDPLTGLYNRAETERMINERLSSLGDRQGGTFCILDLDNFKMINDQNGHDCGDRALTFFSEMLRTTFRYGDIIGRLGGDEFVVYMSLNSDRAVVTRRLDELMERLAEGSGCPNDEYLPPLSCSVGCVIAQAGDNFDTVYTLADKALYRAKASGKRRAEFQTA